MLPYLLAIVGGYLIGNSKDEKYAEGGKIYQIRDPKKRYYSLSMSTGKPVWNESADLGYLFTKEDAEKQKELLGSDLEVVKYDKDWWKYADGGSVTEIQIEKVYNNKMAKGGTIGDAARVKELNKTGVIMKIFKSSDLEQFSDMPRENYYYIKFADGSEGTYGKSELEIFKN